MLALTDAALARLCIAATAVAPGQRGHWLRRVAQELDPPTIPTANVTKPVTKPYRRSPAARRQQRVRDTQAWRARRKRGIAIYPVEVDGNIFDLMERFAGLSLAKMDDRQAVAYALGRLLRRALGALLREANSRH
jgi:hypothetical protein